MRTILNLLVFYEEDINVYINGNELLLGTKLWKLGRTFETQSSIHSL